MGYVTMNIDVDIDMADIDMSDIDTEDLIEELENRKRKGKEIINIPKIGFVFENSKELLNHFKECLGLREFHTKERIIKEIQELD